MKRALNSKNKIIHILESEENEIYTCPVCKEVLQRKFGNVNQFFAHPKGKGDDCEKKMIKFTEEEIITDEDVKDKLQDFYNKEFNDVSIEFSDYMSDEGYKLTKEQTDIIFSKEDRVVVSALAGSSKSTTLYYYAKERPNRKILYVVYNKSMQEEALKTFGKLRNVEVRTMHSLAYGNVMDNSYRRKLTFNYGVVDIIKDLGLNFKKDKQLASQINQYLNDYRLSDKETFSEVYPEELENLSDGNRIKILNYCERLWDMKSDRNSNVKITHDFYLKKFHLMRKDLSRKFDSILVDESQDASMLLLDILNNSNVKNIVLVGDNYQSLYKWRKSVNIMKHFDYDKEYKLTTSFRVSQNIAELSNMIVKDMNNTSINMKGFNSKQKIVNEINLDNKYACLCRTNAGIFESAMDSIGKKIFFEGGFNSYRFNDILDAYLFSRGKQVKNDKFNKFESYRSMKEYSDEVEDVELKAIVKSIETYGRDIPRLVEKIKNDSVKDKSKADVILSTIHRSKGMTYPMPMKIHGDHFDMSKIGDIKLNSDKDLFENMCIIYVAITRCAGEIQLSNNLKNYLFDRLGEK